MRLRRGEVIALQPADVDLTAGTVTIRRSRVELLARPQAFDADPKTDAGKRTVTIPPHVLPILAGHMTSWAGSDRVFVGRDGRPMRGDAIRKAFTRARRKANMPGFRFHDLRHAGQTLAASTGATTKDLMRRLGHASPATPAASSCSVPELTGGQGRWARAGGGSAAGHPVIHAITGKAVRTPPGA